ncbi:hypothetical protein LLG95_01345 [bacterium]|nr:hypothetical protein [bacterium]
MNKMVVQSGVSQTVSAAKRGGHAAKVRAKNKKAVAWASTVPPRLIRNNAENEAALNEIARLGRKADAHKSTPAEIETAKVLMLLVENYERKRFGELAESDENPVERLRYLMEESGMGVVELGLLLGDRSLGTRILSGERQLSKAHIRKLADRFNLSPAYFM